MPSLKGKLQEHDLQDMENGEMECDTAVLLPYQPFALSKSEWCYLSRIRADKSLNDVAKTLKTTAAVIQSIEDGFEDAMLLVEFWEKRAEKAKKRAKARRVASSAV